MTLTPEQQHTLDELIARVPKAPQASVAPDFLETWFGVSSDDLKTKLAALMARKDGWERLLLDWTENNSLDSAIEFLAAASLAFYVAEKGVNPKVHTTIDAFYYIATCASVGYADIFAVTQAGRAIAAFVMIVGPALAARSLDRPTQRKAPG